MIEFEKDELLEFIALAHKYTYAAPKNIKNKFRCKTPILSGHKDFEFINGKFKYHDSYAGSIFAPGREVVFLDDKPIWSMSYQGKPVGEHGHKFYDEQVFPFLKNALRHVEADKPFRGPHNYHDGEFRYIFTMNGDYTYFTGKERIAYNGQLVFLQDVIGSKIL